MFFKLNEIFFRAFADSRETHRWTQCAKGARMGAKRHSTTTKRTPRGTKKSKIRLMDEGVCPYFLVAFNMFLTRSLQGFSASGRLDMTPILGSAAAMHG